MADLPVSALPVAAAAGAADLLYLVQSGASKQITAGTLFATPPAIGGTSPAAGAFTTLSATGAIKSTGANLLNEASAIKLSQEGVALSRLSAYGNNASTQGVFTVRTVSSDGTASTTPVSISSTGLAVTGAITSTGSVTVTGAGSTGGAATAYLGTSSTALLLNTPTGNFGYLASGNNAVVTWSTGAVAITGTLSTTGVATFAAGTVALPSITTSGDTNTGVYFPAADTVGITAGGTQRGAFSSTGLAVTGTITSTGTITGNSDNANFHVNSTNASGYSSVYFQLSGVNKAAIYRNHAAAQFIIGTQGAADPILLAVNSLVIATVSSTGLAVTGELSATTTGKVGTTLGVGAATPSASGSGITFPATQSASTDVNTLDDYEEGTWTPSIGGTATYNTQEGRYTKIGRVVTVSGRLHILLKLTGSGTVVSGLPFTSAATFRYGIAIGKFSAIGNSAFTVYGESPESSTTFELFCTTAAGTSNYVAGVFADNTSIVFSFTYSV